MARRIAEVRPALEAIERATRQGLTAAGYLAYEAAPAFDSAFRVRGGNRMPLLWFGIFDPERVQSNPASGADTRGPPEASGFGAWRLEPRRDRYDESIAVIREAIADGRSYQVNFTGRMRSPFHGEPGALYERLRRSQGPGYHALLELGRHAIVSVSPELFFHREGGRVTTRPMKGTRPRGRWPEEDDARARELLDSEKDRAENRMIVDLLRNDLGRIAETGTVRVPRALEVERYRTVLQMTSTVVAQVPESLGMEHVLGALFPCGSVTGAPKISTMELITRLESSPREVYCGAIGFIDGAAGRATFNVPIRTLWLDRQEGVATYGAGGGVTWDSTAEVEHAELVAKAAVLTREWPEFDLLETMRLEAGSICRRRRHLARLAEACRYFGRPFPEQRVIQALDSVGERGDRTLRRVRLTLSEKGHVAVEGRPLDGDVGAAPHPGQPSPGDGEPQPVVLADRPVDSGDPFLYHKTTHRSLYETHLQNHPGAFDVLLWNERGEATEFTRGNLVVEVEGCLLTPPRAAGLLAGCFRAELLDRELAREAPVPLASLREATRLWRVNSLREWTEVRLVPEPPGRCDGPGAERTPAHSGVDG